MNARIAKEIRTHTPVVGLMALCATTLTIAQIVQQPYHFIDCSAWLMAVYFLGGLMMAASAFGNEFHLRTMSFLLSQPMERRALWSEKMRTLVLFNATSLLINLVAFLVLGGGSYGYQYYDAFELGWLLLMVAVVFSGMAPYFTLLSRSTVGGVVFTLFAAGMLLAPCDTIWHWVNVAGLGELKDKLTGSLLDGPTFIYVILILPCTALCYRLGRRKFLRMEIIDSQALEVSLPTGLEDQLAKFSAPFTGPFSRMLFKELRLQRISLLLTLIFCVSMAVEFLTWRSNNERTFIVGGTLIIYAVLFPIIVGATAVTEEKTWGMKDWHLTLPPSLKLQWRIKWLVAATLALVLGNGLPLFFARIGPWYADLNLQFNPELLCYPLLVAVALYAGSLSTMTIRAFLLTFGIFAAYGFIIAILAAITNVGLNTYGPTGPLALIAIMLADFYGVAIRLLWKLMVWPVWWGTHSLEKARAVSRWAETGHHLPTVLLVLVIGAMFWLLLRFAKTNYRHSDLSRRRVWIQLLVLLFATIFLAVAVVATRSLDVNALLAL